MGTTGGAIGMTGGSSTAGGAGKGGSGAGGSATGGVGAGGAGTGGVGIGGSAGGSSTNVTVQLDNPKQTMQGFGISDIWAPAMTDSEADAMFDPTKGIGLSILRIGMGSDGNPMSSNVYSDIKKATARGVNIFIGTLWSAPGSYKTNDQEYGGGSLTSASYEAWANTIAAFPAKVKQNADVDLTAMSVQNEPDFCGFNGLDPCSSNYASMLFTDTEYVAFVKVVGSKLHALNPPVKVLGPETSEWIHLWTNDSAPGSTNPLNGKYDYGHALYADKDAWAQLDIIGTHQYDTQVAEPWPSDVPQTKPLWMTEMSGIKWWPEEGPSSDINNGVAVAGWIHDAIVNGQASAWLWWWLRAQGTNDNEGLFLMDGTDTKRHYAFGNFSKFIRPGYTRVDITGSIPTDALLTAYTGSDGTVVIVAINKGAASASVPISISGRIAPASLVPWVTSSSDNLVSKTAVSVSGGSFTATLASKTVTTFIGK
jgi:glucuronoarabinoxylan endo-1,4-beta-xylanase